MVNTQSDKISTRTPDRRRRVSAGVAVLGLAVAGGFVVGGPSPVAAAAPVATHVSFVGYAGGTFVRAANSTVTSDITAASTLNTVYNPVRTTNRAAGAKVPSVLSAGAVTTSVRTVTVRGGYRVISTSTTTGINALSGAVTASAIRTTSTASLINGVATQATSTRLTGLTVAGQAIPVTVAKNDTITIPGVATVILNYAQGSTKGRTAFTVGIGAYISLLNPRGDNAVGAEIAISPTQASLAPVRIPPSGHFLGGTAYGSTVTAKVGSLAAVHSDPTAPLALGAFGTKGVTRSTRIAAINLSGALRLGAVRSTVNGTNTKLRYAAVVTNRIAGVNLLDGLVKADSLGARARVSGKPGGKPSVAGSGRFVNLTIGGTRIPADAGPNTTVRLAGVATVTVNAQARRGNAITVRALVIRLTTAGYGLPVGARIVVANASASA